MQRFLLALLAISIMGIAQVNAQATKVQAMGTASTFEEERTAVAVGLKEVLGSLYEERNFAGKLASAGVFPADRAKAYGAEVEAAIARMEGGLDQLRSANESNWAAMKAELEQATAEERAKVEQRHEAVKSQAKGQ